MELQKHPTMLNKEERFKRLATAMLSQMKMPFVFEQMATSYLTSSLPQLDDEKIDEVLENIEKSVAYVKGEVNEFPKF